MSHVQVGLGAVLPMLGGAVPLSACCTSRCAPATRGGDGTSIVQRSATIGLSPPADRGLLVEAPWVGDYVYDESWAIRRAESLGDPSFMELLRLGGDHPFVFLEPGGRLTVHLGMSPQSGITFDFRGTWGTSNEGVWIAAERLQNGGRRLNLNARMWREGGKLLYERLNPMEGYEPPPVVPMGPYRRPPPDPSVRRY